MFFLLNNFLNVLLKTFHLLKFWLVMTMPPIAIHSITFVLMVVHTITIFIFFMFQFPFILKWLPLCTSPFKENLPSFFIVLPSHQPPFPHNSPHLILHFNWTFHHFFSLAFHLCLLYFHFYLLFLHIQCFIIHLVACGPCHHLGPNNI